MGISDVVLQSLVPGSFLVAAVVLLLVYLVSSGSLRSQGGGREPPGPRPLPVLGNLLQLDLKRPYYSLLMLSKKYGSVFTVYLGPKKMVVLAGYKTVKEALVSYADDFGERDPPLIADEENQGHGIVWANGDSWKEMRRFTTMNLRAFGMGRKPCEDKITEECGYLMDLIRSMKGEAFDTTQAVNYAVSNIVVSIIYGSRFEYNDPRFIVMVQQTMKRLKIVATAPIQIYNIFPLIGRWFSARKEIHRVNAFIRKQNLEIFSRLKETLNPQMCRGLVDAFLVQQQSLKDSGNATGHYHDENLMVTVHNLFAAGTESTASTLRWGLLLMAKYPDIQDRVQEEIGRVIGGRQVQVEDRKNLPFTDAVIHETLRLSNIVPATNHRTSRDVTFQGFSIKKGTTVCPLLTSVLYDDEEWEQPLAFYPPHFLDKDGNFVKRDAFLPFSAGRRVCLGESLARMELFIFFTSLLQHFHFTPPPGVSEEELDLTPSVGFTLNPSPHKLCAVPLV